MAKPLAWTLVGILLAAPWVATLWTATYNSATPKLGGFPFFYWYQLMWIPLSVLTTGGAYLLVRWLRQSPKAEQTMRADGTDDTKAGE